MKLEDLLNKERDQRTPLEQCIVDAAYYEDLHVGEYAQMEIAVAELEDLRKGRMDGFSAYNIANAAVDELFTARDGTKAETLTLIYQSRGYGGWGKRSAREIIRKHIQDAMDDLTRRQKESKTLTLARFIKDHKPTCTYHVYSGDRHCSCGRDDAEEELDALLSETRK